MTFFQVFQQRRKQKLRHHNSFEGKVIKLSGHNPSQFPKLCLLKHSQMTTETKQGRGDTE